ncbi:hypothetical protein [Rhodococcus rhodnii]|nr:hypothetical protein [Rhodococcus rhodnii]
MRKTIARAAAALSLAVAATLGTMGTAQAAPAPVPVPAAWTSLTNSLAYVGQNDFCTGVLDINVESEPGKPGSATLVITSRGASGHGPGWAANPNCHVDLLVAWNNAGSIAGPQEQIALDIPAQPGEVVRREMNPGSGLIALTAGLSYLDVNTLQFLPQMSYPVIGYLMVP